MKGRSHCSHCLFTVRRLFCCVVSRSCKTTTCRQQVPGKETRSARESQRASHHWLVAMGTQRVATHTTPLSSIKWMRGDKIELYLNWSLVPTSPSGVLPVGVQQLTSLRWTQPHKMRSAPPPAPRRQQLTHQLRDKALGCRGEIHREHVIPGERRQSVTLSSDVLTGRSPAGSLVHLAAM